MKPPFAVFLSEVALPGLRVDEERARPRDSSPAAIVTSFLTTTSAGMGFILQTKIGMPSLVVVCLTERSSR